MSESALRRFAPVVVTIVFGGNLWAQAAPGRILSRSQATTLEHQGDIEPSAQSVSTQSFPSLLPRNEMEAQAQETLSGKAHALGGSAVTVACSLMVVLGLFAALVWGTRRFGGGSMSQGALPKEVVQCLGSTPIDSRTRLTMIRCGNRIIVVAQSPTGVQPISEITDPDEVHQLTASCSSDSRRAFASTLASIEKEKTAPGYVDSSQPRPSKRDRGRLFATA